MAVRDWSARPILTMWLVGMAVECTLALALVGSGGTDSHPQFLRDAGDSAPAILGNPSDPRRKELYGELRDSLGIAVIVSGDTLTTFQRDSFSMAVHTRGDTVRDVTLSPSAQRTVARAIEGVAAGLNAIGPKLL